jgi:hypothetical protein
VATKIVEKSRPVEYIGALEPGLAFEYKVRAEKGSYGDFPERYRANECSPEIADKRFRFELHGSWLVRAYVHSEEAGGHAVQFDVLHGDDLLMGMLGIVLPRRESLTAIEKVHYGEHPIQERYATRIEPLRVNGQEPENSRRLLIPARNIIKGSLLRMGVRVEGLQQTPDMAYN